jgi:hypothetical protein
VESLILYFDRCLGKKVPEALARLTCPFQVRWHEGEGFRQDLEDDKWLHQVGSKKWVVISHDAKWHREPSAIEAIRQHKIKCFYLYGASSQMFFKLGALSHNWRKIRGKITSENGPFIYRISIYNRLSKVL